ncbi:DUF317 domain-containing protein [Streptomyces scabiei]|uniref:DUF317 domain-containing protein n=1 Tax=Streptomyces scabiei TaxID=1930 RepID=UPI0029B2B420|nr:DUF317 domain-containing protein [Streptomyces scabiei]MDX3523260.1 DUF317 domain-containing protein [Streptomyces scabiei]
MRFLSQDAVDEVLVSPPCLAGGGDPRWITVALHQASGWRYDHTPLSPVAHLVRPDQQAELSLYPDPDEPWWTILHAPTTEHPAWYARFGARIPVEILAAFTDALTDPGPSTEPSDPFEILYATGWVEHSDVSASSPDGPVRVERVGQGRGSWFITTSLPGNPDAVLWHAHLDANTPLHLVAAFTRALTDATPLYRDLLALPRPVRPHIHTNPVSSDLTDVALDPLEQRVQNLAARRRRPAPAPPPRPPEPPPRRTR